MTRGSDTTHASGGRLPMSVRAIVISAAATVAVVATGLVAVGRYVTLTEPQAASLMVVEHEAFEPAPRSILPREVRTEASEAIEQVSPVIETAAIAQPQQVVSESLPMPQPVEFDGRPMRIARTMRMVVTGYSPDDRSCGIYADGRTASGYSIWTNGMKLVAADTKVLPFKSVITVPGYNDARPVPVLDRGGAIKGNRLDLLFPTHKQARDWGVRTLDVTVWEYAD